MKNFIWLLIILAVLSLILAVLGSVVLQSPTGVGGVAAEGLSSACTNLLLLAIALMLVTKNKE